MRCRRSVLHDIRATSTTNAALWMHKYLSAQTDGVGDDDATKDARAQLIRDMTSVSVPHGYTQAFERRRRSFEDDPSVLSAVATGASRIVVGLGDKGVVEWGLHLDHTWGVPVLPGSALKGLAAAAAHALVVGGAWRKPDQKSAALRTPRLDYDLLFGTTDESGCVVFHDAWWIPDRTATLPIVADVVTVHHPGYYQEADPATPSDMDSPLPVSFAAVPADRGAFLVAVEGDRAWCDSTMRLLGIGLAVLGVGAKTNAGYGRLRLAGYEPDPPAPIAHRAAPAAPAREQAPVATAAPAPPSRPATVSDRPPPMLPAALAGANVVAAWVWVEGTGGNRKLKARGTQRVNDRHLHKVVVDDQAHERLSRSSREAPVPAALTLGDDRKTILAVRLLP